jgi:N-acetylglucosaminyl-diphospho-decaprenol L-rhamnosyltransferase
MDLSVVTVSYNTRELLRACLASVLSALAQGPKHELIVVDNASRDGSASMVRDEFPRVQLIANEDNRGFAAASNQGIQQSSGRCVLLLNPDTIVKSTALQRMSAVLESRDDVGAVGPKLVYPNGELQHSAFTFPTITMIFLDFFPLHHRLLDSPINGRYPRSLYEGNEPFPIDHPLGAALMAKRQVIEHVGLLDERFYMYCEEIDWCMRIKNSGGRILCVPQAEIVHHVAQSTSQLGPQMFVELHRSRYRLYEKHYSASFRRAARWIVSLGLTYLEVRDRWEAKRGALDSGTLANRLKAYQEIREL